MSFPHPGLYRPPYGLSSQNIFTSPWAPVHQARPPLVSESPPAPYLSPPGRAQHGEDPSDDDDLPSVADLLQPEAQSQVELIDLTLDDPDQGTPAILDSSSRTASLVSSTSTGHQPILAVPALSALGSPSQESQRLPAQLRASVANLEATPTTKQTPPRLKASSFKNIPHWASPSGKLDKARVTAVVDGLDASGVKAGVNVCSTDYLSTRVSTFIDSMFIEDIEEISRPPKRPARVQITSPKTAWQTAPETTLEPALETTDGVTHDDRQGNTGPGHAAEGRVGSEVASPGDKAHDPVLLDRSWQVDRVLRQSGSGSMFEAVVTKTVWLPQAALGRLPLRRFRAEQRRAAPARRSARLRTFRA